MKRTRSVSLTSGIFVGVSCTLIFVAVAAVAARLASVPNPMYRQFEWLSGVMPGALVTKGIDLTVGLVRMIGVGSTATAAKVVERVLAIVLVVMIGAGLGAVCAALVRRGRSPAWIGVAIGAAWGLFYVGVVARMLDASALVSLAGFIGWGALMGITLGKLEVHEGVAPERRHALVAIGVATATTCLAAFGVLRVLGRSAQRVARILRTEDEAAATSGAAVSPPREALTARFTPVPGTRPELTDTADFYRVDINLTPPSVNGDRWRLDIGGLVATPSTLTLDQVRARPAVSQIITLECISNPVGGDLIGTSRWTGCRLADLLDELGVGTSARAVSFDAADGFHETASLADARDPRALLVYAMNGEPLTEAHGFPLRLYLPNRHGMKLPKWIQRMELVETPRPGYWVERGWSATAIPHTTSVIDTVQAAGEGDRRTTSVGGIAYAGARGIQRVEVQIDDGPWQEAKLRAPALSPLTWVQWRLDVSYRHGPHTFRVRAYDGTGAPQETVVRPPHPDGATGLYRKRETV